jgi:hypothetical protein
LQLKGQSVSTVTLSPLLKLSLQQGLSVAGLATLPEMARSRCF